MPALHKSFLKGGAQLSVSQAIVQACSFVRNVIVARLITPDDFGIAAIFVMTFFLLDMISNLSADTLLIQAKDGDEPLFQATAHSLHLIRGITNSIVLFVLAGPISHLFGVPKARLAFEVLALLPLIRGLNHLDMNRLQRELKFGPVIAVNSGSSILITLLALPLGFWFHDYWLMLWLLLGQSVLAMMISHWKADRHFEFAWNAQYARRFFSFGWPLLINGLLMYIILQGDRFMIGSGSRLFARSHYTLADLGVYSVAFALTFAPTMLVANVSTPLFLPTLSQVQGLRAEFEKQYLACAQLVSLLAAMISILFIVAGPWLLVAIYGKKYAAAGAFIGWLAAMQAMRTVRIAPTVAAMALGDTKNAMVCNIVRTTALLGVLFVVYRGLDLTWIAASGFLGEVLALATCLWRLKREHDLGSAIALKPFVATALGMGSGTLIVVSNVLRIGPPMFTPVIALLLMCATLCVMIVASPIFRENVRVLARQTQASTNSASA